MSGQDDGKAKQGLTAPKLPIPGGAEGFKLGPGAQGMLRVPVQTPGAPSCQDEGDATFPSPEPKGIPNQILSTPRVGEKGARHPREGVFMALSGLWAWKKLLQAGLSPAGPCSPAVLEEKLAATKAT